MAKPPLLAGASHDTVAVVSLSPAAVTFVGGSGTPGVTAAEAADAAESPWVLAAITVNV